MSKEQLHYKDVFNFTLHQPIGVLEGYLAETLTEMYKNNIVPVSYIRDKKHPLFINTIQQLKADKIEIELEIIVLGIVHHKEFKT